ncbi:MAG: MBL fold metallo-hydrolase [Leptolyngbya sp. PLA3]|nr:MAG: MBL fold metallo-hydrolase [Cyanobacteria bacterium CYA]MCE7968426.1 MBL fold metallo-hydrolase [Leptolyngbya sp. PL-A3]
MTDSNVQGPIIECFPLGDYQTNCYIVRSHAACWIADVGFEPRLLLERVQDLHLPVEVIVLTHCHFDHIAGLQEARSALPDVPIWVHQAEQRWLSDPMLNLSALVGLRITGPEPARTLNDGDTLTLAGQPWKVLHTPGHSPGGISLHHAASRQALVGDTLFNGSIGRTDFPGSDFQTLSRSIRTKLYTLPDDTRVYPGHGPSTSIGHEKRTNPFVRQ